MTAQGVVSAWRDGWVFVCVWVYNVTHPIMHLMLHVYFPASTETEQQCSCLYSAGHVTWQGMLGYTAPLREQNS